MKICKDGGEQGPDTPVIRLPRPSALRVKSRGNKGTGRVMGKIENCLF